MLAPSSHPSLTSVFAPRTSIEADGTVEGYASLFGEIDQARDMILRGAFAETLAARGPRRIPMLFQHDPSEPIGIWLDLREDHRGLFARGRLIPEVARARELFSLLKAGAIDGLSIGFRAAKASVDAKTRVRRLAAIDLWEISIVTFPLLAGARVRAVKQAATMKQIGAAADERLLRRHPRFSFSRARAEREWANIAGAPAKSDLSSPGLSHGLSRPSGLTRGTSRPHRP